MVKLKVKLLNGKATLPSYTREGDACMDICSCENYLLKAGEFKDISTGISVQIPKNYEMQIRARSGLANKFGIGLLNGIGTIDYEYRGEIKVILKNNSTKDFQIEEGMRIAQICLFKVNKIKVEKTNYLTSTNRGENGFGSSGLKEKA